MLLTWEQLSTTTLAEPSFLIDPYIVREGITLLWAGTSLGKCFGRGTSIMMASGRTQLVETIRVGDTVMGPDSRPRTVLETHTGKAPLYKVTMTDGTEWTASGNHILRLWNKHHKKWIEESVDDFLKRDNQDSFLMRKTGIELPSHKLRLDPYFMGLLLGDGSMQNGIGITTADEDIKEEVYNQAKKWDMRIKIKLSKVKTCPTYKLIRRKGAGYSVGTRSRGRVATTRNPIIHELKRLGLYGTDAGTKFIPQMYLLNGRKERLELFAGLLDTDGYVKGSTGEFTSKSKQLAENIQWLARSLGFKASPVRSKLAMGLQYWRVHFGKLTPEIPVRLNRKIPVASKRKPFNNIGFKLTPVEVGDFFGFSVDGDHLHLIGDFTITHNSPVTWQMASAIGNGEPFFGLPTTQGKVLYIELDTPPPAIIPRINKLPPAKNVWWYFSKPLSIPYVGADVKEEFVRMRNELQPDVVFLNTLRKLHDLDDKDSATPKLVYSFFQNLFPKSALVFVHHTRKSPIDPKFQENDKESFSGSNHFLDDAQVGLHLQKYDGEKENLRLWHRKSQVSELLRPLPLKLEKDGSTLSSPLVDELEYIRTLFSDGKKAPDVIRETASYLGISESSARRRVNVVQNNLFPGRGFLSPSEESI